MKRFLLFIIGLLLVPSFAFASPVSWDYSNSILQPLQALWSAQIRGSYFTATSTSPSTFPNASTTNITAVGATTTNIAVTGQTRLASLSGLLKAVSGVVSVATAGTDYIANTLGDWTGTFDGQEGTFYLNRGNHTGTQASSTIVGGFDVPSGGTGATTLSGLLKGAGTAPITTATPGVDYLVSAPGSVLTIFTGGIGSQNYISTTSPFGLVINASSSILGIDTRNATLTNATGTTLVVTNATSTNFRTQNDSFVNGTGTALVVTNATTSNLNIVSTIQGAGLTSCSGATNALTYNIATDLFGCNTITSGVSFGEAWRIFVGGTGSTNYLAPTSTLGVVLTASSSINFLNSIGATSTYATSSFLTTSFGTSTTFFSNLAQILNLSTTYATNTNLVFTNATGTSLSLTRATTSAFAISSLINCDTIDTGSDGSFRCGTDASGGGGSTFGETLRLFTGGAGSVSYLAPTTTLGIVTNASSSFFGIDARLATATEATTTNLFTSNLRVGSLTGVLKGTSGIVSTASNGTDFTLITGTTCSGSDKVSAISASGVVTCSADVSGGGGSSGGWATTTDRNSELGTVNYTQSSTYIGGSASTTAVFNFNKDLAQLTIATTTASSTGAFYLGSNGVSILADTDGAITFTSLGNTFKEAFSIDLDNVSNEIGITSTTSVDRFNFGSIGLNSLASSTLRFLTSIGATTTNSTTTNGYVSNIFGIGTTSPAAQFALSTTTTSSIFPIFSIASSTGIMSNLLSVFNFTQSELLPMANIGFASTSIPSSGIRLSIGGNRPPADMRDQFLFNGRINTGEWFSFQCANNNGLTTAAVTADTIAACGDFQFQAAGTGAQFLTTNRHPILSMTGATANMGSGLFLGATPVYTFASNTPIMEFSLNASNTLPASNLSTSTLVAGWTNLVQTATTWTIPTAGCFITASGTPAGVGATLNYWAVSKTSNANQTAVDTGVGLITNQYFATFRIEYDANGCTYLYRNPTSTQWTTIATHAQNFVASTTGMSPGIGIYRGAVTGGVSNVYINYIKVWLRKTTWF